MQIRTPASLWMLWELGDAVRLVNELKGNAADHVVLTGDGKADAEVLKALCIRYNGKGIIWYPKPPMKGRRISGLGVFKAIKIYPGKYHLYNFLVLVDREHFIERMMDRRRDRKKRDEKGMIEEYLTNVVQIKLSPLKDISPGSAWRASGALGPHKLRIYPVIMGKKKAMEEEFASLLILERDKLKLTTRD
ncbi:MAG: hypothetical protein KAU14_02100 [Thermoplasmata archaeon]|nr:hypothetical protein [Thermoplasmata archaeon]